MTLDNNLGFSSHEIISKKLEINTYFLNLYSVWEIGVNENINEFIRQYFPKGIDFNKISNQGINLVVTRLNNLLKNSGWQSSLIDYLKEYEIVYS
ncbi:hypothetical protein C5472_20485 [Photorhabdus sp. RW14-46]|nr:hypothetical protein [Photorhabdus sp. RW14-46]